MRRSITPNIGIAPDVVKQAMHEYTSIAQGMEPMDDAARDQLEGKYQKRGVPKSVTAAYRKWCRENG